MTGGVRQTLILVYPAHLTAPPPWPSGPLPHEHRGHRATAGRRTTYFTPRTARLLYGTAEQPRRWHRPLNHQHGPATLLGLELLHAGPHAGDGLAVVHLEVPDNAPPGTLLDALRSLAHRTHTSAPTTGIIALFNGHATIAPDATPFTLTLLTAAAWPLSPLYPAAYDHWPPVGQWLWALASRTTHADYPPDPDHLEELLGTPVHLSADWRALVLRDGAAFVGLRPDTGTDDPFFGHAETNVRTLYLDAVLLGMLQRHQIDALADDVATAFDHHDFTARLTALETRIARFRASHWVQHLTSHGHANDLLLAYQAQHRLPDRFDEILTEVADFARLAQTQESQQLNAALGLLTVLGLPLGTALAALQVLGYNQPWQLLAGTTLALTLTTGLLATRFGRAVLRALRAGRPHEQTPP